MKRVFFLLLLMMGGFCMTTYAQVETVSARSGYMLYYPSMERAKMKKGERLIVLQRLDNGNFLVIYHDRRALVDISFLKVNEGIYRLIRTKELMQEQDKELQAYEDSVRNAYKLRLREEGLQKIAEKNLVYEGTVLRQTAITPIRDKAFETKDTFEKDEKVQVFYLSEEYKLAGVFNDRLYGYVNIDDVEVEEERDVKVLLAIPEEDKNRYADYVMEEQKMKMEKVIQAQMDEMLQSLLKQMYKDGFPILLVDCYPTNVNMVGHVDVYLEYINLSGKAIRSVTFTGYFNNQEGKAIANEISPHNKSVTCRDFNAVKAYEKSMKTCSDLSYYNKNVKSFVITAIRVQYKDGSSASMNSAKCQALMDKNRNFTPEERRFFKERWL